MRQTRIERLDGHVLADGFVYDARNLSAAERDEILSRWDSGSSLLTDERRLLHRLGAPLRVSVADTWGAPVVRAERESLATFRGAHPRDQEPRLFWLERGQVVSAVLRDLSVTTPANWFELDYEFCEGESVEAPAKAPALAIVPKTDVREALGNVVGAPPPELARVLRGVQALGESKTARSSRLRWLAATAAGLLAGLAALSRWRPALGTSPYSTRRTSRGEKSRALFRLSLVGKLTNQVKKWLWRSRLGSLLGRQHAKYLEEVFGLFERGDFEEALRRALPTTNTPTDGDKTYRLSPPLRRENLALRQKAGGGSGVTLDESLFGNLRETYRRAFQELKRRGDHQRAAFVLAELLDEASEAVDYLESNGFAREAAELAEARDLPPERLVRQWIVAKDRERAVRIAIREGAFEGAVRRLTERPDLRSELRLLWANHCSESGAFLQAARILYEEKTATGLVEKLLERAAEDPGLDGSQALLELITRFPERIPQYWERARDLFEEETVALAPLRLHAAKVLAARPSGPPGGALERLAVRALLRDHGEQRVVVPRELAAKLALKSGDGGLHVDLPDFEVDAVTSRPLVLELPGDRGRSLSAEFLCSGKLLVARGETGLELHGRDGRVSRRFEVPCEKFVVSANETRVIALARRGETTVLHRVELDSGRCDRWGELALGNYAEGFDGEVFYVAVGGRIHALDATASTPTESLWVSAPLAGVVAWIAAGPRELHYAVVSADGEAEAWTHSTRPYRLVRRIPSGRDGFADTTGRRLELVFDEAREILKMGDRSVLVRDTREEGAAVFWRASDDPRFLHRIEWSEGIGRETVFDLDEFHVAAETTSNGTASANAVRRGRRSWTDTAGNVYWCDLERRVLLERRNIR